MSLTVLSVGYPLARVSPSTAGGAEQILACLDRELVAAGHTSLVVAPEGSECAGHLIATPASDSNLNEEVQRDARENHRLAIAQVLRHYPVDLIHFHGIDFHEYLPDTDIPVIVTLHLPLSWYPVHAFSSRFKLNFVCVSQAQLRSAPCLPGVGRVIENGIDLSAFSPSHRKSDYVVGLGRICPEKGFHYAIDASQACGLPFYLAGHLYDYPSHREYFQREIAPRLTGTTRFLGEVGGEQKRDLLAEARCLVVASSAPETSSLVAMEAMASGTPVVAFRVGALSELIDHGNTGFLVESVREMEEGIQSVARLDSLECRRQAEKRFTHTRMCGQYFEFYHALAMRSRLPLVQKRSSPITARAISRIQDVEPLLSEWEELWGRCSQTTTFQRSQWLWPYMRHFTPYEPLIYEFRSDNRLVGLAPFLVFERDGERVLGLIGGGLSDYLDILIDPLFEREVLRGLARELDLRADTWDRIDFTDLPAHSALLKIRKEIGNQTIVHDACPVLSLSSTVSELPNVIPAHQLRNLRNARRRMGDAGSIEVACAGQASRFLEELIELHSGRWQQDGEPGVLADPAVRKFHHDVVANLAVSGVLRLYRLRWRNAVIAALYAFVERDTVYCYLQGYDIKFREFSPGAQVLARVIEDAVREGKSSLDMLRGRESYKYAWGAKDRKTYRLQAAATKRHPKSQVV